MRYKDTDSTERSLQDTSSPLLKPALAAGERTCHLASSDKLDRFQNDKSRRVRALLGIEHVGLLSDSPPGQTELLFILSSEHLPMLYQVHPSKDIPVPVCFALPPPVTVIERGFS